jgi:hypothetical protein
MPDPKPTIEELAIADDTAAWRRLGFEVDGDRCRIGAVRLRLLGGDAGSGIVGWTVRGLSANDLDGVPTSLAGPASPGAEVPESPAPHPNGALAIDHVVVLTPNLERTNRALERAGLELRRIREAGTGQNPVRQGFFRLGDVILEVVEARAEGEVETAPARFWGLVVVVDDLDRVAAMLGRDLGAPKDAVQPGRRIATVRGSAGLSLPLALMTPDPRR